MRGLRGSAPREGIPLARGADGLSKGRAAETNWQRANGDGSLVRRSELRHPY
jgi:hypothetical protein